MTASSCGNGLMTGCADGWSSKSVAAELGVHEHTVGKWRRRLLKDRCDGLLDEARPGPPHTIDDGGPLPQPSMPTIWQAVLDLFARLHPGDASHGEKLRVAPVEPNLPK